MRLTGFQPSVLAFAVAVVLCVAAIVPDKAAADVQSSQVAALSNGSLDASPASHALTVDTDPPETTITAQPHSQTISHNALFMFTADEPVSTFRCQLDDGPIDNCNVLATISNLSLGSHTFRVAARDLAGNTDPTPATYTWTIFITPTTRDDCMDNGWRAALDANDQPFRHQGDCVRYVATRGRP
jgi:large repetitive protein